MDLSTFAIRHDPTTCATCAAIYEAQRPKCPTCGSADCVFFAMQNGFDPMFEAAVMDAALDELGITDEELDLLFSDNEDSYDELARVIGEVRVGNFLTASEGATLVDALAQEQAAHADTLVDLGDAEYRIGELETEVAVRDVLLDLAGATLDLTADAIERQAGAMLGAQLYISILEARIAELEARPTVIINAFI